MKRFLLFLFILLSHNLYSQDFDKLNSTVIVAGEFEGGSKNIGNGIIVCNKDGCCLVTADHLLKLNGRYTTSATVIIPTTPSLSSDEIHQKLGDDSKWHYHSGGISISVYAYSVCFLDSRIDMRGMMFEYPFEYLKNGLILTKPIPMEDIADDSDIVAGAFVATVGTLFNTTSRWFTPQIDTGRVVALAGDKIQYSGKGVEGLSGSPVWMMRGDKMKLVGIHSYHAKEFESYAIKASIIKSKMK
jgi:hypothetical protein